MNPDFTPDHTLVLQSHRLPLPHPWLEPALASVRAWAMTKGYGYRFVDDALFAELSERERRQCGAQPVVASDLARLRLCRRLLDEGPQRVVWCDADTVIFDPAALTLSAQSSAFGRELWLQHDAEAASFRPDSPFDSRPKNKRVKLYKKIHNAFMQFSRGDPVLDFYIFAAARLIDRHSRQTREPMVPQLAGPKFLSHLHNVLQFEVLESAQVMSPLLAEGLLSQERRLLRRYARAWSEPPAALNLCASEVIRGALRNEDMQRLVDLLLSRGIEAFQADGAIGTGVG